MSKFLALLSLVAVTLSPQAFAQDSMEPYPVSVWARVLFGTDGKPVEYALVDEAQYPAKFAENLKQRVAKAHIRPPEVDGKPATLRSGVELRFNVTPNAQGGIVKFEGISMDALPVKKYYASYPKDIAMTEGWDGKATGVCKIGINGRCASIEVEALPGMPVSVRKHVRASLEQWEFEPQQINGKPVEGEFKLSIHYQTLDKAPEDFREDKFLRLLKSRE